ncbi:class I SAM-dependent methyltransferase [Tumidithrix helvetica PCC 7403]|uniref:class I SAM-dependent methyltransferase n=1 Tax=Tumidithrix helvetica TaxID=3457545 RepID=UPI003CB93D8A
MTNFFSNLRTQQIVASQDKLLKSFLHDRDFANKMANHPLHACLGKWLPHDSNAKILELGCGPGKYVALLSKLDFKDITGVDPHRFPTWDILEKETSVKLLDNIFAEQLPFADASFDYVVCLGALLYFQNPDKAFSEISRVLKPNGRLILRTVNKNNLYTLRTGEKLDPASNNLYTMQELMGFVSTKGFQIIDSFAFGYHPPILPSLWWYLSCVWIPTFMQELLSNSLQPEYRINNAICAVKL